MLTEDYYLYNILGGVFYILLTCTKSIHYEDKIYFANGNGLFAYRPGNIWPKF